jgi:hypothetical protein
MSVLQSVAFHMHVRVAERGISHACRCVPPESSRISLLCTLACFLLLPAGNEHRQNKLTRLLLVVSGCQRHTYFQPTETHACLVACMFADESVCIQMNLYASWVGVYVHQFVCRNKKCVCLMAHKLLLNCSCGCMRRKWVPHPPLTSRVHNTTFSAL